MESIRDGNPCKKLQRDFEEGNWVFCPHNPALAQLRRQFRSRSDATLHRMRAPYGARPKFDLILLWQPLALATTGSGIRAAGNRVLAELMNLPAFVNHEPSSPRHGHHPRPTVFARRRVRVLAVGAVVTTKEMTGDRPKLPRRWKRWPYEAVKSDKQGLFVWTATRVPLHHGSATGNARGTDDRFCKLISCMGSSPDDCPRTCECSQIQGSRYSCQFTFSFLAHSPSHTRSHSR